MPIRRYVAEARQLLSESKGALSGIMNKSNYHALNGNGVDAWEYKRKVGGATLRITHWDQHAAEHPRSGLPFTADAETRSRSGGGGIVLPDGSTRWTTKGKKDEGTKTWKEAAARLLKWAEAHA